MILKGCEAVEGFHHLLSGPVQPDIVVWRGRERYAGFTSVEHARFVIGIAGWTDAVIRTGEGSSTYDDQVAPPGQAATAVDPEGL